MKYFDIIITLLIVGIVLLMILPIPTFLLDIFQIINIFRAVCGKRQNCYRIFIFCPERTGNQKKNAQAKDKFEIFFHDYLPFFQRLRLNMGDF